MDNMKIRMSVEFDSFGEADKKLKALLKQLQEANKLNVTVDQNAFKNLEAQFNQLKKKLGEQITPKVDTGNNDKFIAQLDKIKAKLEQMGNSNVNYKAQTDSYGQITGAMVKYTDTTGKVIKENYKVSQSFKDIDANGNFASKLKQVIEKDLTQTNQAMKKAYGELEAEKRRIERLVDTKANIKFNTNPSGDITSASISYTDKTGKMITNNYKLLESLKETENQIVKTFSWKNTSNTYTDNIQKSIKVLESFQSQLEKVKKANDSLATGGGSTQFNSNYNTALKETNDLLKRGTSITDAERQKIMEKIKLLNEENSLINRNNATSKQLYGELGSLQQQEFGIRQKLVGAEGERKAQLEGQLSIIRQQQTETAKLVASQGLQNKDNVNSYLQQRQKMVSDLTISQDRQNQKEKEQTTEIQKQIELYRQQANIKIQNLNTSYGSLMNDNNIKAQVLQFQQALGGLNTNNFNAKELNNQFAQIQANVRASSSAMRLAQRDAVSFGDALKQAFEKFPLWYVVSGVVTGVIGGFKNAVSTVIEIEDALVSLNKVVDISKTQMEQLTEESFRLGTALGKSSKDILNSMAEFGRYNKNIDDVTELSRVAVMASNVTTLTAADSAKALNTAMITFGINAKDSVSILNSWNELKCMAPYTVMYM